jgi:hypothetical protein
MLRVSIFIQDRIDCSGFGLSFSGTIAALMDLLRVVNTMMKYAVEDAVEAFRNLVKVLEGKLTLV